MDGRGEEAQATGMPPPAWYPDPYGGYGLRWWDGARWSERVAVPTWPAAAHRTSVRTGTFAMEYVLAALGSAFWLFVLVMGTGGCTSSEPECYDAISHAAVALIVGVVAVMVASGAVLGWASRRPERNDARLLVAILLPVGVAAAWVLSLAAATT